MRFAPKDWLKRTIGPLSVIVVSSLVFEDSAFAENSRNKGICSTKEHRRNEKRFVSVFMKEDPLTRWKLPSMVSVREIQDESCTINVYHHIDAVYWPDGGHTDFKDCLYLGNLVGDCVDEQGRHWRTKVFAKTTDEVPWEHDYPEIFIPDIRALLRE